MEMILLIPHNLGFGSILEMTLLGGCWDPLKVSWRTGEVEYSKNLKILNGLIETIPLILNVPGLGRNMRFPEIWGVSPNISGIQVLRRPI